jgi:hypothetical protein
MEVGKLRTILKSLGSSAEEVAATLQTHGIRGVRNTTRILNPIVRYAQGRVPGNAMSLDVMKPDTLRLIHQSGAEEEASLPLPVRHFLDAFNRGMHPDLELPEEQA